jgi:hypothetical protein
LVHTHEATRYLYPPQVALQAVQSE